MTNENINTKDISSPPPVGGEVRGGFIVTNLTVKQQDNTMLDAISFELNTNNHLAIVGSSGSGKTTLTKALCGKIFYQGTIEFGNKKPSINFVEQHYHFKNRSNTNDFYYQQRYNSFDSNDALTVIEELQALSNDDNYINALLSRLQLSHRKQSPLLHLSSGEHKRFQLIKALLIPAQILILDEPFIGLDINSRKQLYNILNEVAAKGTQIILITDANEIPSCITHIAHLEKGKLRNFTEKNSFNFAEITLSDNYHYINSDTLPISKSQHDFSTAVKMVNVFVQYGDKKILSNINWNIQHGEKWLLKGNNGAGKSTLLSLINGDNPQAYANEIYLFDKRRGSGESIWDIKQKIGYVSPELHWYFDTSITVYQAIGSGFFDTIGLYKKLTHYQHRLIEQWSNLLQLSHLQHNRVSSISTSEQRLTLLLRALVKDPLLLLLDEPCQGLDDHQTAQFVELVDVLCEQLNKTLI
ncbi:MAG TPA: ATP-binding cassette domain-containing protein, partial [Chitinophagaceae bacterium]|nr:ATP-binding cassette domain-containing protein [Chitinophagaceae bacterium]